MKTQSDIYFYANEKKNNYVRQQKKLDYLQNPIIQNPAVCEFILRLCMFNRKSDILLLYLDVQLYWIFCDGSQLKIHCNRE